MPFNWQHVNCIPPNGPKPAWIQVERLNFGFQRSLRQLLCLRGSQGCQLVCFKDFGFIPATLPSAATISQLWFVLSDGGNCSAHWLVLLAVAVEDAYMASDVALDKDASAHKAISKALLSSISLRRSHSGTEARCVINLWFLWKVCTQTKLFWKATGVTADCGKMVVVKPQRWIICCRSPAVRKMGTNTGQTCGLNGFTILPSGAWIHPFILW